MRKLALAAALIVTGCGKTDAPAPAPPPAATPDTPVTPTAPPSKEPSREGVAQAMYDAAAKKGSLAAFHEVAVRVPDTAPGRRALEQCASLEGAEHDSHERQFLEPDRKAREFAKAGRFDAAIDLLLKFGKDHDSLNRKVDRRIEELRNEARDAYMKAVRAARTAPLDEAMILIKVAAEHSTPEVREAASRDFALIDRVRAARETKRASAAEAESSRILGERAISWLKRIRERAYAEVLKEMETALADPKLAPSKERLAADRDAVKSAAAFWDAVHKTIKANVNQPVAYRTSDNKVIRGTLKRVTDVSIRIENLDVPLAMIHADQLVLLALHREALPEDAGASYASAAMWFFLEGKPDLSRLLLATSAEMGPAAESLETAWRRGFFRLVMGR
jgi:hypothetical protein